MQVLALHLTLGVCAAYSQFNLIVVTRRQEPDLLNHPSERSRRVCPSREPKDIHLVPGPIVVHEVLVGIAQKIGMIPACQLSPSWPVPSDTWSSGREPHHANILSVVSAIPALILPHVLAWSGSTVPTPLE